MDGRRFEDTMSVADLMKRPQKELMAEIYIQTLKTNGTLIYHQEQINELKDNVKLRATCADLTDLKIEVKDKIGMKLFAIITGIIGLIILVFNILDRVLIT